MLDFFKNNELSKIILGTGRFNLMLRKVMFMNKSEFIKKLGKLTNLEEEKCIKINEILESHMIIGKKGKEQIICDLMEKLKFDKEKANNIYNICMEIIGKGLKEKIIHPFKDLD